MSEAASDQELLSDIAYLQKAWQKIQQDSQFAAERSLIFSDLSLAKKMLRDVVNDETVNICVDSKAIFQQLSAFSELYAAKALSLLSHYQGERPIFDFYNVEQEITRALAKKVELPSGGYLIFDQTEALVSIDVNTGSFVSGKNLSDTTFKTNLEAAQAIARQLRLRNLGGIIIIDFIDMDTDAQRETVLEELKKSVALDRVRTNIHGFTALGLVEMTRKRTRESLAHLLCEPCQACHGRGEHKTAQTICYEIMRQLLRESKQFNAQAFKVIASVAVIDLLQDEEAQNLANLSDFIQKNVSLQADNQYAHEAFAIVWT
jgi:ribonuclease G